MAETEKTLDHVYSSKKTTFCFLGQIFYKKNISQIFCPDGYGNVVVFFLENLTFLSILKAVFSKPLIPVQYDSFSVNIKANQYF